MFVKPKCARTVYATVQFLMYPHMFRQPLAFIRELIHQYIYNIMKYATNLSVILQGINIHRLEIYRISTPDFIRRDFIISQCL